MSDFNKESMLEVYIYEVSHLLEGLENTVLEAEKGLTTEHINDIFRAMHTIKGSSAMMGYSSIEKTSHAIEDLFYYFRENVVKEPDSRKVVDLILEAVDFIKSEIEKVESNEELSSESEYEGLLKLIQDYLAEVKATNEGTGDIDSKEIEVVPESEFYIFEEDESNNDFYVHFMFSEKCMIKSIRAFTILSNWEKSFGNVVSAPKDLIDDKNQKEMEEHGFKLSVKTQKDFDEILREINKTTEIDSVDIEFVSKEKPEDISDIYKIQVENFEGLSARFDETVKLLEALSLKAFRIEMPALKLGKPKDEILEIVIFTNERKKSIEDILFNCGLSRKFTIEDITEEDIENNIDEFPHFINEDMKNVLNALKKAKGKDSKKEPSKSEENTVVEHSSKKNLANSIISVNVNKLDTLLNLVGELVIAEVMVLENPELEGMELPNFRKNARQLRKIINDVQDVVMGLRMVPLTTSFHKMQRLVRDLSIKLGKDVELEIIGDDTEMDRNIIENISDPLMHIIRNSVDHGLESPKERIACGKNPTGTIVLEAKNSGGDVIISVSDDGRGLNTEAIWKKAYSKGFIKKAFHECSEEELQGLIFRPGFSTSDDITEISGRGVGLDVVTENLAAVGGKVEVSSKAGVGTQFTLRIPLTLAIIRGMIVTVGSNKFTIPIISIVQSIKANQSQISKDPDGNEIIKIRERLYNLVRLADFFDIESPVTNVEDGIVVLIENGKKSLGIFVDDIVGESQVVVKSIPSYIGSVRGISSCTLLGDGEISLIIDTQEFFDN